MVLTKDCTSTMVTLASTGKPAASRLPRNELLKAKEPVSAKDAAGAPEPVVKRGVWAMLGRFMTMKFRAPALASVRTAPATAAEAVLPAAATAVRFCVAGLEIVLSTSLAPASRTNKSVAFGVRPRAWKKPSCCVSVGTALPAAAVAPANAKLMLVVTVGAAAVCRCNVGTRISE